MSGPALFIFAKAPIAGSVKTRLQPRYTATQAAEIAAVLIRETVALAVETWDGPVYLSVTPTVDHPLFRELCAHRVLVVRPQTGADLGARMREAIAYGTAQHGAAGVIGCDVPHCPPAAMRDASRWLREDRNVFGPAMDGGYYFVGLTRPQPELFHDIAWGSDQVWPTTQERLTSLGITYELLPTLRDIDTAEDIVHAAQSVAALRPFLRDR